MIDSGEFTKDVVQISIDVLDDTETLTASKVKKILEDKGLIVLGASWRASWHEEDYHEGKPPYSYD